MEPEKVAPSGGHLLSHSIQGVPSFTELYRLSRNGPYPLILKLYHTIRGEAFDFELYTAIVIAWLSRKEVGGANVQAMNWRMAPT